MNQPAQRTQEWFAARVGRLTGSRIGAVLGLSPYATRDDVLREMVREFAGADREFTGNVATEYGTKHEPDALSEYEAVTGHIVDEAGLIVHPQHEWLAASPDGLVNDNHGVEIKCPYSGDLKAIEEQPHYMAQIQLCMAVTGRGTWDYFAWAPNAHRLQTVQAEDGWLDKHMPELEAFMADYRAAIASEESMQPHLEPLERDMSEDDEWVGLAAEYREIDAQMKDLKKRQDAIKKALIKRADQKKSKGAGLMVYPTTRQGSIDTEALAKATGLDLETYRKAPSTSWTVRLVKEAA